MTTCGGCKQNQLLLAEVLCLSCVEDLKLWLKTIPVLFEELEHVRLPGSVRTAGPYAKTSSMGGAAPVRLAVVDLADRGEVRARLWSCWPEDWPAPQLSRYDVEGLCTWYTQNLLNLVVMDGAVNMYRKIRGLVRDLGRTVGEPQDLPVGKCPRPMGVDGELCRGQLLRAGDSATVYCRRCGDRPEIVDQEVWVTAMEAHLIVGKPLKTVRNWFNRGLVGWSPPLSRDQGWLPIIVRRAALATIPHSSGTVNPESGAEPSNRSHEQAASGRQFDKCSDSDGDVLGQQATGNVTPPAVATVGTVVAPVSLGAVPEQGPQYPSLAGNKGPSTATAPTTSNGSGSMSPEVGPEPDQ